MSVLPDCTICGGRVESVVDGDGAMEVCWGCGTAWWPEAPPPPRREVRAQVREIRRTRPLLCPSCLGRRCYACHAVTCECPGHHPRRPKPAKEKP